jgi:CheY-like chemotaxis protein
MARILVVDDYTALLFMLRAVLELAGHDVEMAEIGAACLEKVQEWRPDLVLLDTHMPGLEGVSVCARLKQDAALAKIPVVMMTGRPTGQVFARAEHAGARVLLLKPFTRDRLVREIRQALAES